MDEGNSQDWDLTGVIPPFKLDANQQYKLEVISMAEDGSYRGSGRSRDSRKQASGYPNSYELALEAYDHYRSTCVRRQDQYNDFMSEWLQEWATKHTRPHTDTSRWLKDQMSRWRAKGPPDPLRVRNRPTLEGWRNWVEWGRNEAPPPARAGRPKDDRSEQPPREEDDRFQGESLPSKGTAPLPVAAGGGAGGGGGSSGGSSHGDRAGVGGSRETAEIVAGCDPAFVAALKRWDTMETHIATQAEGGYANAADFGMFLDSPGLERLYAKMDKDEDGILNERNRQTLYWFHFWLLEQQRAKVDLETIDIELFTRKVMAELISSKYNSKYVGQTF
jgi:hypothetical protein